MMAQAQSPRSDDADALAWGERLAAAYREIGDRAMRDLPIYNDALGVEAVGFRPYNGTIVGIVVTPWFMNVVISAGEMAWEASVPSLRLRFPAGDIDFAVSEVASVGRIASCSLFSPMFGFADMVSARATAEAALAELMLSADSEEAVRRRAPATSTIDRRNFLRGVLTERSG
jgi:[NiFe] hydrogenase assembly HybE family chaperone